MKASNDDSKEANDNHQSADRDFVSAVSGLNDFTNDFTHRAREGEEIAIEESNAEQYGVLIKRSSKSRQGGVRIKQKAAIKEATDVS